MQDNSVLVIVTPGFAADESDSTCMPSQQNLIKAINQLEPALEIVIVTLQYPYQRSTYDWFGNKVIAFNGKYKNPMRRVMMWWRVFKKLKEIRRNRNVTGLLSFWCGEAALISHWFCKGYHLKHYCWVLGQDARGSNSFIKLIRPTSSELIAVSEFVQKEFLRNHGIKPSRIIENGVVDNVREHALTKPRSVDIIGVGSLNKLKRYNLFVDVIKQLKQHIPGIHAVICGEGPQNFALRASIREKHLSDNVVLEGEQPHHKVQQYLLNATILLHPSEYEGFSTVCLEALHAGCYVVSFTSPGNISTDRWLVVNSVEEMVETCRSLLMDHRKQYISVSLHSINESARRFLDLYLPV